MTTYATIKLRREVIDVLQEFCREYYYDGISNAKCILNIVLDFFRQNENKDEIFRKYMKELLNIMRQLGYIDEY